MFEWIPYNQFIDIKETEIQSFITAIWSNGPLTFNNESVKYQRNLNKRVTLKFFYNSQNVSIEFLNKMKSHLTEGIISYGISQNPNTKDYILVFCEKYIEKCCKNCGEKYTNEIYKWCKLLCSINEKSMKIFDFIDDFKFNWVPYNEFNDIKEMGRGGFSTVYSAIWRYKKVALKCLHNSHNFINEFLNEVKAYRAYSSEDIIKIYGISQNPDTGDFIMILECAEGGNFNGYLYKNHEVFDWLNKLQILIDIIRGLKKIHQKHMVHRDFHIGNILFKYIKYNNTCISDMGLCKEVGNNDETKIYGVMPYVAPEVLRGGHYTQAADIYSFGMIMYFVATGKQPFSDRAHDKLLALDICNGIRPEINEPEAPKCYIDLMKKCWNSNPTNRPNVFKIEEFIWLFYNSYISNASKFKYIMKIEKEQQHYEIEKQFKEAEEYRKENPISIKDIQSTTHPQAVYTSRLLNSFTKDLPSECFDCAIDDL
uniref:Protein kinase domain-containing protein n=1 Tax=Rhizophagus irregularis (strain DAOM 181602 / DAOM 197198 / MUCL 43194) TaxID=747089 RepID=U9TLT7_RHIID